MYYIKKISIFFKNNIIFNYFYGSGSGYPRVIEYRDGYPKFGYPETTNPDPDIKFTDPEVPKISRISGSVPGLNIISDFLFVC